MWGNLAVGSEVLQVTQKYGGAVLGALEKGKLVGFIYAFLARYRGRLAHWSHMMAVDQQHRDQGLGFQMKLAHRELALREGIKSVCWTYDPLQSRNAFLNIRRLGARVEEYLTDCYGRFPSRIEKGLPSDRFVVNWQIGSSRVERRLRGAPFGDADAGLPRINETRCNPQGFVANRRIRDSFDEPRLLLEIPSNTDEMRARALNLAQRWRLETRRMFLGACEAGYRVVDFVVMRPDRDIRAFYVLGKEQHAKEYSTSPGGQSPDRV